MKKISLLVIALVMTSCYKSDYQNSVNEEFPGSTSFAINTNLNAAFVVIDKDSSVYFVECARFLSTKPSDKQFLFNIKKRK